MFGPYIDISRRCDLVLFKSCNLSARKKLVKALEYETISVLTKSMTA